MNPKDPGTLRALEYKLEEIAKLPNSNVIIDMDLGVELRHIGFHHNNYKFLPGDSTLTFADQWAPQTRMAGEVGARLAERYLDHHPTQQGVQAEIRLISHSAGCEAALNEIGRKLTTGRQLFSESIAMSVRDPGAFPPRTIMVLAANDFPASPRGTPEAHLGGCGRITEAGTSGHQDRESAKKWLVGLDPWASRIQGSPRLVVSRPQNLRFFRAVVANRWCFQAYR